MGQHHGKDCSRSCLPPLPRCVLTYIPVTPMDNQSFRLSRPPYPPYGGVQTYPKTTVHQFVFYQKTSSSTSLQIAQSVPRSPFVWSIVGDSARSYDTHSPYAFRSRSLEVQIAETPLYHYCDSHDPDSTCKPVCVDHRERLDFKFLFNGAWRRVSSWDSEPPFSPDLRFLLGR